MANVNKNRFKAGTYERRAELPRGADGDETPRPSFGAALRPRAGENLEQKVVLQQLLFGLYGSGANSSYGRTFAQ